MVCESCAGYLSGLYAADNRYRDAADQHQLIMFDGQGAIDPDLKVG